MREPLVLPAVAMAAGIAASRYGAFSQRELPLLVSAFCVLGLLARWRRNTILVWVCVFFATLFGGGWLEMLHRPGPAPELDAGPREIVILSGCIVEPPVRYEDHLRFVLELAPGARARVSLYQKDGEPFPRLTYGQQLEVDAQVRRPRNFGNPGTFDYAGYLARRDIYWTAYARPGAQLKVSSGSCGSPILRTVYSVRSAALERLDSMYQGKPWESAMTQAVLVGEKTKLERAWTEQFRFTGTYHALVISGLHLTVLAGTWLFLLRLCGLPSAVILMVVSAGAWLYAAVAGWQPPVVRAAAGLTLFLIARWFFRKPRLLNILAAIGIAFLTFDPYQLFEASFQLSFLSVAAIAALAVPLLDRTSSPLVRGLRGLRDRGRDPHLEPRVAQFRVETRLLAETLYFWTRLPERLALAVLAFAYRVIFGVYELVVVSASVQVGLALPMVVYFHRLPLSGLLANVVVVPLMSLVVPIGFLAIFTGWGPVAWLTGWLLSMTRVIVEWHAAWEPWWRIPDPPVWLAASLILSLILLGLANRSHRRWRWFAGTAVSLLLLVLIVHPFPPRVNAGELEVASIDVGQGDSAFLSLPAGKLMVLDGGGAPGFGKRSGGLDPGEEVVSPYLWSRSVRRLDVVALSHAHEDHIGGLNAIVKNFKPAELWMGPAPDTPSWRQLRDTALRQGVRIRRLCAGERFPYGGAIVEVLAPPEDSPPSGSPKDLDSMVFRVSFGDRSFLLTGDLDNRVEYDLIEAGAIRPADVLKVAHHGSRRSSSEGFLAAVHPAFAIISVSANNTYGHPHPELLRRLNDAHTTTLRTDEWGFVSFVTDGRRLGLTTWRSLHPQSGPLQPF